MALVGPRPLPFGLRPARAVAVAVAVKSTFGGGVTCRLFSIPVHPAENSATTTRVLLIERLTAASSTVHRGQVHGSGRRRSGSSPSASSSGGGGGGRGGCGGERDADGDGFVSVGTRRRTPTAATDNRGGGGRGSSDSLGTSGDITTTATTTLLAVWWGSRQRVSRGGRHVLFCSQRRRLAAFPLSFLSSPRRVAYFVARRRSPLLCVRRPVLVSTHKGGRARPLTNKQK